MTKITECVITSVMWTDPKRVKGEYADALNKYNADIIDEKLIIKLESAEQLGNLVEELGKSVIVNGIDENGRLHIEIYDDFIE